MADQGKLIQAIITAAQMQLLWQPVIQTLTKPIAGNFWFTSAAAWF